MKVEIRSATEAVISGYVNAVDRDSRPLPPSMCPRAAKRFVEKVRPGAFKKAIGHSGDIEIRFNHGKTIGGTADKSLELYEDNIGLFAKATVHDTEVIEKARRKELRGWSFGFADPKDEWENVDDDTDRRYLDDFELREVSILDRTPAYIGTSVASVEIRDGELTELETRSADDECTEFSELEQREEADEKETALNIENKRRRIEIERLRY